MNYKFFLIVPLLFLCFSVSAQEQGGGAFEDPAIEDDMTIDPEQNQKWRDGQYPYSAKPKNMWELGVHAGYSFISGDVESPFFAGYGFGLHLRKAINYTLSVRLDGWYNSSKGFDARPILPSTLRVERLFAQNNNGIDGYVNEGGRVHRNYRTSIVGGSIEGLINIGNLLFHQPRNKYNFYAVVGIGLNIPSTKVDLLNGSSLYNFESVTSGLNLDTQKDRREARKNLKDLLDGDYETEGGVETNVIALGDDKTVIPHLNFGLGISRKFSERVNLGIEWQIIVADNDLYDGFEYRTQFDETNNLDIPHYISARLGINLGDFSKKTEPLYWLNPISGPLNDLAEVKARPLLDLTDTDGDGIIDMLDQEINSQDGAPVDTRGVVLDSDGDGIADFQDQEPFSAPGYEVDENGVARVDLPYLTEEEVNDLINQKVANIRTDWFLPMIHFDLDKYYVKPEFYGQLHHVATVLKMHPGLKVVVTGSADVRNPGDYNAVLSYRRAQATIDFLMDKYDFPRDRFVLQFTGEDVPLVPDLPDNHAISKQLEMQQYMNRRVEFRVASPDDENMDEPEGPDAGEGTPGSSREGSKYSGNKSSGYE